MKYEARELTLKNGARLILRSPAPEDAEALLDYLRRVAGETYFLMAYPDEPGKTLAEEREFLERALASKRQLMLSAFDGARVVGNCSFNEISPREKARHRAGLGIAVTREFWGCGLGRALLREAAARAKDAGYEQLELGVYADNERALRLYESEGYALCGRIPNAFRLRDGSYRDELMMAKAL